jgi:hypothetical protein
MPLTTYTRTVTLSAAPIMVATPAGNPTQLTAGGDVYAVPAAWGARKPQVGDVLVQLPSGALAWLPSATMTGLALNPLAGPWVPTDRVICPRVTPTDVMEVVTVAPEGYYCRSIRSPTLLLMQAWDLETAP